MEKTSPLVMERSYDATPAQIWAALTDPTQMKLWYLNIPDFKAELGHQFQFEGGPPDKTYLHKCVVKEVVPNQVIAYSWRFDGYPGDSLVRFEILPEGEKTKVRLTHSGIESFMSPDTPDFDVKNFEMGWTHILNSNLADFMAAKFSLEITRTLDAPRDLVFKMWTDPEHLANWWGPAGMGLRVVSFDLQPGGIFHYAMVAQNGAEMFGRMAYRQINPPERLVWVNSFADAEGNVAQSSYFPNNEFPLEILNVLRLEEENGKTLLTLSGGPINASAEQEAFYLGMIPNMEQGFGGTFQQLEKYLASLK
jgi:uncharacterized protein YndB with AHSA1/START domain